MLKPILIDISQPIHAATPVWPGDTPFSIRETWTISDECPVRVSKLTLSTHTGTHADAHSHYERDGEDSAGRALDAYIGPCVVVTVAAQGDAVTPGEVLPQLDGDAKDAERVLIHTFERFPHDAWPAHFRALSPALIDALAERGCRLIGTDAPSIDPETSKTMDAHHAVHRHDMAILEGLVFDGVADGRYELIALPLKIVGADASPVRAVLRPLDEAPATRSLY